MTTVYTPVDQEKVQQEERDSCEAYIRKHDIDGLVRTLTEKLLQARPATHPKEHFAHLLRMDALRSKLGSDGCSFSEQELFEASKASEVPGRLLVNLFEATKNITSEIVPKETINTIINETIGLLNCDRVSLFVHDTRIGMLVLSASNLDVPIRVKPGQGIAGACFKTKELVNIPNCYEDPRFDTSFDQQTGYRTNNLICQPIVDFEGECMGVLQAINKLDSDQFSRIDEILMENLTQHCSIALRNAEVYRAAIVTNERANALLHMIQSLSNGLGLQSLVLTVTMHAKELMQADRCSVFLVDEKKHQLWSVATDTGDEIIIPKSMGIAGECATEGKLIVIPDAYEDPRFNQEIDQTTGYTTRSIMAVPVKKRMNTGGENSVLAVIEMINKMEFDGQVGKFDEEDVRVMETFATFVASKLEGSSLLSPSDTTSRANEASSAFGDVGDRPEYHSVGHQNRATMGVGMGDFIEGDEEDEDEKA